MPKIAPFRGLRFAKDDLARVIAPPYDVISPADRKTLGERSPHNVAHVDLPEGEGDSKYAHAAELLSEWTKTGVLAPDDEAVILPYHQAFSAPGGGSEVVRKGFFALLRLSAYEAREVLPHERTLSGPKEDRLKLFVATRTNVSPVFVLYSDPEHAVDHALSKTRQNLAELETEDGIRHRLMRVSDRAALERTVQVLSRAPVLIADGHHRYETALRFEGEVDAARAASDRPPAPERAAHRWVLAYFVNQDDPGLLVLPTHRLVHGVQIDASTLSQKAAPYFNQFSSQAHDLTALLRTMADGRDRTPTFAAVFPDGNSLILSLREDVGAASIPGLRERPKALWRCDVAVLHGAILEGMLGIDQAAQAAQTNLVYVKDTHEAVRRILQKEGSVLFLMNATPVRQVREVAMAGEVMPQKSTYFYPKVPTGLVMHVLDPDVEI
ncbi:MAG: DUF1015 domain-containing protein [Deltaproteobacteria bacterium]|nr:DUF1015 domain-containing protein [Deltaproteobacteria bacterium]